MGPMGICITWGAFVGLTTGIFLIPFLPFWLVLIIALTIYTFGVFILLDTND